VPAGAARPTLKMAWVETGLREQGELSTASSAIWPQHKEDPAPLAAVPGHSVGAARFELATPCSQILWRATVGNCSIRETRCGAKLFASFLDPASTARTSQKPWGLSQGLSQRRVRNPAQCSPLQQGLEAGMVEGVQTRVESQPVDA
jgi:hypothetical protein